MLEGKNILLGITGSIAAYKAAVLVRCLVKRGAKVKVLMTPSSKEFITPLTMATLSGSPVLTEFFNPENGEWNSHVKLGLWADLYVIAPASANTIAKMANGIADNLLLTTYLSVRCPVMVAPAMDMDMYSHPTNIENLNKLASIGVDIAEPASGELASGLEGKGRMEEPEIICARIEEFFKKKSSLKGKRVLISAGPTREPIDPVRYISNHSSGKMGYAIASEFAFRGADVMLVSGPTACKIENSSVKIFPVTTADEMYEKCVELFSTEPDITILAAAVADYAPAEYSTSKIKKEGSQSSITLRKNRDIAEQIGNTSMRRGIVAGFALETDNEEFNAMEKMRRKNLDMIILNSLNDKGAGFMTDTNKITIFSKSGERSEFPLMTKKETASAIVDYINKIV